MINILQSEQIFETENSHLKHKASSWNIEQIFEVRNKYSKYGINIQNIEQTFEIKNKEQLFSIQNYQLVVKCCYGINQSNQVEISPYNSTLRLV